MRFRVCALALCAFLAANALGQIKQDKIVVKFDNAAPEAMQTILLSGMKVEKVIPQIGWTKFQLPPRMNYRQARALLQGLPGVEAIEPDFDLHTTQVSPNDVQYPTQWPLTIIGAPIAWIYTKGNANVKVAVLDTGVDTDHPDLAGKVVLGRDFTTADGVNSYEDGHGHGTHCSGTVAAVTNNSIGVSSIGWNTSLMIGKVLSDGGSGSWVDVASGITWSADSGANVISLSLGGGGGSQGVLDACNYAKGRGVFIAAAAGNNGNTNLFYPASYDSCVAVASTTNTDVRSSFSNYGSWVDIAAPGSNILSTTRGGGYGQMSGTSMACPHIAGMAALVIARNPGVHPDKNLIIMQSTGTTITSGFGSFPIKRINADKAVQY